jgi:hypothetical protein
LKKNLSAIIADVSGGMKLCRGICLLTMAEPFKLMLQPLESVLHPNDTF